jgi:beta-lactam-binding protein with PASTA domain
MPDLVGRSEDDAINVIVDAGMHVPTINTQAAQPTPPPATTPGSTPPAASTGSGSRMVVKTTPAAGQRIFAGQAIAIEVTP